MIPTIRSAFIALLCCLFVSLFGNAQSSNNINISIEPVEPFRIAGNIYYVGSSDLTSYLIVTPKGNIIIDGGPKEMVPLIKTSIEKLGFKFSDTKLILNSHAHFDHAGGIAELRRLTGARFLASERDAPLLKRGGLDDPNFADRFPFESTSPDETFRNGRRVNLGRTVMTANVTAGHTPGCTTWTTTVREKSRDLRVIFVCSVSQPGYNLVGNEKYPMIESDYRKSFNWFRNTKVDIFLGSHAGFFDLAEKSERLRSGAQTNPFIDPEGYRRYIENNAKAFEERLKQLKGGK